MEEEAYEEVEEEAPKDEAEIEVVCLFPQQLLLLVLFYFSYVFVSKCYDTFLLVSLAFVLPQKRCSYRKLIRLNI